MTQRNISIAIVLIILSFISWWLSEIVSPRSQDFRGKIVRHNPDYYLDVFTLTSMGADGEPAYKLVSNHMIHYPDDDSSELTMPRLTIYREEESPWQIDANRGWVLGEGDFVLLREDVVVERVKSPNNSPIKITTEELRVRPNDEYAETDKYVLMVSDKSSMEGVGMRAYFKKGQLQLLKNTKSRYVN